MTIERGKEFARKGTLKHNGKFNYEQAIEEYTNNKTPVTIICLDHGPFKQRPDTHLTGKGGCLQCKNESISKHRTNSWSYVLARFIKKHGNKYDYSKAKYINTTTLITIICPHHGEFQQLPKEHCRYGCERCSYEIRALKRTKTTSDFINNAIKIHGDKYSYSLTNYITAKIKVTIICPYHGEFEQLPR